MHEPRSMTQARMQELIICPNCKERMHWRSDQVVCPGCLRRFPVVNDIPVLLLEEELAQHDELEHISEHEHKLRQSAYFDRTELAEFEMTRPRNAPRLYQWLLVEKSRRSVAGIEPFVGNLVLTVCGGSGMDADFLAERGAEVIASDISLGAALRCRERARRYGLRITSIVADVENLPFRDKSIDIVYVHDGLHHLRRPLDGLDEMTRVASRWISITEPAKARVTAFAVRLGLAKEYEEAGNRVRRLSTSELEDMLRSKGFAAVHISRYAMYYPHKPGGIFAALSRPAIFPLIKWLWRAGNFCLGHFGNKLSVVATRVQAGTAFDVVAGPRATATAEEPR